MPPSTQGLDHLDWLLQDFLASLRFSPAMAAYGFGWWDASWGRAEEMPQVTCAVGIELVPVALLPLQLILSSPCRMLQFICWLTTSQALQSCRKVAQLAALASFCLT